MSSRITGVFDTGATYGHLEEAEIALAWANELRKACVRVGITVYLTRVSVNDPAPLRQRVAAAKKAKCTHLISLHVNDAEVAKANGYETLYRVAGSEMFARHLHGQMLGLLGLRDRGIKNRTDLAIIATGGMPSALLEMGFIRNRGDMAIVTDATIMQRACAALAASLIAWEKAHQ
jgi:N-acetylmuramoyl-L-alanine amidase